MQPACVVLLDDEGRRPCPRPGAAGALVVRGDGLGGPLCVALLAIFLECRPVSLRPARRRPGGRATGGRAGYGRPGVTGSGESSGGVAELLPAGSPMGDSTLGPAGAAGLPMHETL